MFNTEREEREAVFEAIEFVDKNIRSKEESEGIINECDLIKMCGSESQYTEYDLIQT